MADRTTIATKLNYLGKELMDAIWDCADVKTFAAGTELVREGQYIKVIPIVLSGLVKVFTQIEDKELLLYYIQPEQSCIMSFSSCLNQEKSKIFALTEEETEALLLPAEKVMQWVTQHPAINKLFYQQYDLRYSELIDTIHHLLYHKLDKRLLDYLTEKIKVTGKNPLKITHKEIATELGTAREVVSRLVKKLEKQGLLQQYHDSIGLPHD
jgi:CRP/FNR family transcriptional regulator, anaerobic regulatory protein